MPDLENLISFSDDQLWDVLLQHPVQQHETQLKELISHGKQRSLSPDEETQINELIDQIDQSILLRSQALLLLKQRGHEVEKLFKLSDSKD